MVSARLIGGNEVRALATQLSANSVRVGARVAAAVRTVALKIEADAKALAPVDTGYLRSSISTSFMGDGRSLGMSAIIGPTANYGAYVEFGTYKMAPQPYMMPALQRNEGAFYSAIERAARPLG